MNNKKGIWSADIPPETGWYWARNHIRHIASIIYIQHSDDGPRIYALNGQFSNVMAAELMLEFYSEKITEPENCRVDYENF